MSAIVVPQYPYELINVLAWASQYEDVQMAGYRPSGVVYEDAQERAYVLLDPLWSYLPTDSWGQVVKRKLWYNAVLHYIIVTYHKLVDADGLTISENTLYTKYDIANKGLIITSASDESSSASMLVPDSLQHGDFTLNDLYRTPYGQLVYQILEQMNINVIRL